MLEEHRTYLSDAKRLEAYRRALEATVRPGSVVLDLGAGTGVLGLMACRAGAARVYAVDSGPILSLAAESAALSGFGDRVLPVRGLSTEVTLPEKVDVVVADQMGPFGLEAGIVRYFSDARRRHLAPGGALVPRAVEVLAAPVEDPALHAKVAFWAGRPAGFDFAPFARAARATLQWPRLEAERLLGPPVPLVRADLSLAEPGPLSSETVLDVSRDGTLHGLACWFRADLAPGVSFTNGPADPDRIDRPVAFLPLGDPVPVRTGDRISLAFRAIPDAPIFSWRGEVARPGREAHPFAGASLESEPLGAGDLLLRSPDHRPRLGRRGEAARAVLDRCDGNATVGELRGLVERDFADLFANPGEAEAFVTRVLAEGAVMPAGRRRG